MEGEQEEVADVVDTQSGVGEADMLRSVGLTDAEISDVMASEDPVPHAEDGEKVYSPDNFDEDQAAEMMKAALEGELGLEIPDSAVKGLPNYKLILDELSPNGKALVQNLMRQMQNVSREASETKAQAAQTRQDVAAERVSSVVSDRMIASLEAKVEKGKAAVASDPAGSKPETIKAIMQAEAAEGMLETLLEEREHHQKAAAAASVEKFIEEHAELKVASFRSEVRDLMEARPLLLEEAYEIIRSRRERAGTLPKSVAAPKTAEAKRREAAHRAVAPVVQRPGSARPRRDGPVHIDPQADDAVEQAMAAAMAQGIL